MVPTRLMSLSRRSMSGSCQLRKFEWEFGWWKTQALLWKRDCAAERLKPVGGVFGKVFKGELFVRGEFGVGWVSMVKFTFDGLNCLQIAPKEGSVEGGDEENQ